MLFTVSSNKGTVQAADAHQGQPGVQIRAVKGRLAFAVAAEAATAAGSMEISATHALATACTGKVTLTNTSLAPLALMGVQVVFEVQ